MTATVMFNGALFEGEVLRQTPRRMLVKFTVPSSGTTRESWFTTVPKPEGRLVSRRQYRSESGLVTMPGNSGFIN